MSTTSNFDNIIRDPDRSFSYAFGPYTLHSAFQPIIEPRPEGLTVAGYHGQIRVMRHGETCTPAEFIGSIDSQDMGALDGQMAVLHICNAQLFMNEDATIHVARNPRHFHSLQDMKTDAARQRAYALNAGIDPRRVVCEMRLRDSDDMDHVMQFAGQMRRAGFQIGLDGYAGEERDLQRLRTLSPNFVRFDPAWVADLVKSNAGLALLAVIVKQFREQNVHAIFTCVEDEAAVAMLERIGAARLQGHALARPERAPAIFSDRFLVKPLQTPAVQQPQRQAAAPQPDAERLRATAAAMEAPVQPSRPAVRRNAPAFGKRGLG